MKIFLVILVLLFFKISHAETILIPSIDKIFKENVLQLGGPNKPFYGCLIDIQYTEEEIDSLTDEIISPSIISYITIGNVNNFIQAYVIDYMPKDSITTPKIGDCFAFLLDYPMKSSSFGSRLSYGWVTIYPNNDYKVDNEIKLVSPSNKIDVEKYFNDNVNYGSKKIILSGIVTGINNEDIISDYNDEHIHFELSSPTHKNSWTNNYIIIAFYYAKLWKNNEQIKNKLKSINIGDTISVEGFFDVDFVGATHSFQIVKIFD